MTWTDNASPLVGLRLLVAEDLHAVACEVVDFIESLGCSVVGPVPTSALGLGLLTRHSIDGAILDVQLAGGTSFPLAEALQERGVPFIFVTGFDDVFDHSRFPGVPVIGKPFDEVELRAAMLEAFAGIPRAAH